MSLSKPQKFKVSPPSYDLLAKIITLGDSTVGKTSLIMKFTEGSFIYSQLPTIGVELKTKTVDVDDKRLKFELWDTAGQERFRKIATDHLKAVQGVILCYAVNDRMSFLSIGDWMKQIKQSPSSSVPIVLVATKSDVDSSQTDLLLPRCVDEAEGQALAAQYGIPFLETSAVNGTNVERVFDTIGKLVLERYGNIPKSVPQLKPEPELEVEPFEENHCCLLSFLKPFRKNKKEVKKQRKIVKTSVMMTYQNESLCKIISSYENRILT